MVNNLDFLCHNLWCSVRVVDGLPRAGSHYNLGTSRGPDKIGSRAGPGPRLAHGCFRSSQGPKYVSSDEDSDCRERN